VQGLGDPRLRGDDARAVILSENEIRVSLHSRGDPSGENGDAQERQETGGGALEGCGYRRPCGKRPAEGREIAGGDRQPHKERARNR